MSRALQMLLGAFSLALALWSCTAILGDFPKTTADGDLGDASGMDGTTNPEPDAGSPDVPGTDATDSGGGTDSTTSDAPNPGDDGSGSTCSPQAVRCSGNSVQTCSANGTWGAPVQCMNQACSMGACAGTCPPNTTQCSGNAVQKCDATGHLGLPTACVNQACVSGACQGVCMPGDATCSSSGGLQTCDTTGAWGPATACGAHQSCTGGGAAGPAMCTCSPVPACRTAGLTCASTSTLIVCAQDSQACWYASSTSTCSSGACFGNPGSAQCCTNACTAGATQCGGAGLQTCQALGNGCTAWNAGTACGTHQSCTGGAGTANCTCNMDPMCSTTGTVCATSTSTATCVQDAQNCFYASSASPCGANKNCQNGTCACNSGYTPCAGNCVNINNDNNNCGACNNVCPVLSSPSSGSTCGLLSAGQCAGYVGGYVQTGGGPLLSNPDGQSVFAIKAQMPATAGTFYGIGAVVGSNDTSGTTQMIYGLYSDSGGAPGALYFKTNYNDTSLQFADPSSLFTQRSSGGLYSNGFNNALAANTAYWIYMKAGSNSSMGDIAGVSSSPCVGAQWINVDPPASFSGTVACPGDYALYMIVTFP